MSRSNVLFHTPMPRFVVQAGDTNAPFTTYRLDPAASSTRHDYYVGSRYYRPKQNTEKVQFVPSKQISL
eukprot:1046471-Rhodomonas_salina.1